MSLLDSLKNLVVNNSPTLRRLAEYPTNRHIHIQDGESYLKYDSHSIKDSQSILDTSATKLGEKWGGRNPVFYNYDPSYLNSLSTKFMVFKGSPEIKTFEDVIYMPQYSCLYSSDGLRINDSCTYRGYGRKILMTKAPDKIEPPKKLKRINQRFMYVGIIEGHYGHFLTNNIAPLWYAAKDEQYPILCHGVRKKAFIDIFLKSINLDIRRFISFNYPVCLKEVIVPHPSFSIKCEGFEVHRLLPENVAKRLLETREKITSQPLYFSRRNLDPTRRIIVNEYKLERELHEKGFAIFFPEKLSLKEQINLINKHEVIIGMQGSALHNIIFDISPKRNIVCLGDKVDLNTNFLIIDAIKSVKSVYISALEKDANIFKLNKPNMILDLDIALDGLRDLGLL